ncbi:MAG: HEPN domain-containing protein [Rubrobacteraceae bacterium]
MALAECARRGCAIGGGGCLITGSRQANYRLRLARGFLDEARQDADLGRWRSAVDGAQLSVENAAKAGLALAGRIGRTHNPATQIRRAIEEERFDADLSEKLRRLAELSELLGPDIHIQTDYGDEAEGRTPWELFTEEDARQALAIVEEAVGIAEDLVRRFPS